MEVVESRSVSYYITNCKSISYDTSFITYYSSGFVLHLPSMVKSTLSVSTETPLLYTRLYVCYFSSLRTPVDRPLRKVSLCSPFNSRDSIPTHTGQSLSRPSGRTDVIPFDLLLLVYSDFFSRPRSRTETSIQSFKPRIHITLRYRTKLIPLIQ